MRINKILQLSVIGAMAIGVASCSDTENAPVPQGQDGVIRFAANTDVSSRASDITTNNLTKFNVYAYTGSGSNRVTFMDNVEVTKTSSNTWTYSPVKYWPASPVDFYAYAPDTWVGSSGPLSPVKYTNYEANTDLVYAVSPNLTGNSHLPNAQVIFNFRHALSKVTIYLSSTNTDLKVNVTNVALANIRATGYFSFPSESTSGQPTTESTGQWTDLTDALPYMLHLSQRADEVITLTSTPNDLSEGGLGGDKYMIPQPLTYSSNGSDNDNYLAIMCSVYDVKTGVKLWPNSNTPAENIVEGSTFGDGLLKFPLSTSQLSAWQPGYHYVYNLVVNANSDMGSIEFGTPTVDSYINVESTYE